MIPVIVEPDARNEIRGARDWYEARQANVGAEFVAEIDAAMRAVSDRPQSFPVVARDVRRALVRRFPYLILFVARRDVVIVIGVFHTSRDPDLVLRRAGGLGT